MYILLGNTDWPDDDDIERVKSMPQVLKDELMAYKEAGSHDRYPECLWYDHESRKCRNYEWRPSICREFEVGSDGCLSWREQFQVDHCSPSST